MKPSTQNWINYCFSAYSCGNYKLASEVMDSINEIIARTADSDSKNGPALKPHELNELLLFNSLLLEKGESVKKAIKFLTAAKNRKNIIDDIRYNERLASLYMQNNQKGKAIDCYNDLISYNPNNEKVYLDVLKAKDLDVQNKDHH